mgnify:CR=1 FL=1
MDGFREIIEDLPNKIDFMLKACHEMKLGSEPDDTADYWEERPLINKSINSLTLIKDKLPKFE